MDYIASDDKAKKEVLGLLEKADKIAARVSYDKYDYESNLEFFDTALDMYVELNAFDEIKKLKEKGYFLLH